MHTLTHAPCDVVQNNRRMAEVHRHVAADQRVQSVAAPYRAGKLQPFCGTDRLTCQRAHPAAGADHAHSGHATRLYRRGRGPAVADPGAGSLGSSDRNSRIVGPKLSDRRTETLGSSGGKSRIVGRKVSDGRAESLGWSGGKSRIVV